MSWGILPSYWFLNKINLDSWTRTLVLWEFCNLQWCLALIVTNNETIFLTILFLWLTRFSTCLSRFWNRSGCNSLTMLQTWTAILLTRFFSENKFDFSRMGVKRVLEILTILSKDRVGAVNPPLFFILSRSLALPLSIFCKYSWQYTHISLETLFLNVSSNVV